MGDYMKLAILSDVHLGYAWGTERQEDPFEAMEEALEKSLDCDAILVVGDMFDTRIPSTEVFTGAMEMFIKPLTKPSDAEITGGINKKTDRLLPMSSGIPIIAIHGTHERRARGLINPVQALEKAGFVAHIHCNGVVLEKNGEKVAIQGLSGVPDQYAESVLKQWNPKPMENAFNIFLIHQSIKQFMFAPSAIDLESIPKGFDYYICGHMHEPKETKYDDSPLLIPGSFVPTQMTKDASIPRGFWVIETRNPVKATFIEFENQRKVYHKVFNTDMKREIITEELAALLNKPLKKKPVVRIDFVGKSGVPDDYLDEIRTRFSGRAILHFRKDVDDEKPVVRSIDEQRLSAQETGRKALENNLKEFKLDPRVFENVFELVLENKLDDAVDLLSRKTE
jgi:DNA repair exonuclease SbcCD nuclease subunit